MLQVPESVPILFMYNLCILLIDCSFCVFPFIQGLDFIVDAGLRIAEPSTVVDMTGTVPRIIRLGKVCGCWCKNISSVLLTNYLYQILCIILATGEALHLSLHESWGLSLPIYMGRCSLLVMD